MPRSIGAAEPVKIRGSMINFPPVCRVSGCWEIARGGSYAPEFVCCSGWCGDRSHASDCHRGRASTLISAIARSGSPATSLPLRHPPPSVTYLHDHFFSYLSVRTAGRFVPNGLASLPSRRRSPQFFTDDLSCSDAKDPDLSFSLLPSVSRARSIGNAVSAGTLSFP